MNSQKLFLQIVIKLVFIVILAGCATSHQSPNVALTTPTVTSNPSLHQTPSVLLTTPTVIADRGNKIWDYVDLGDSTQFAFMTRYAVILQKDLGVMVKVHDMTIGGQSSGLMLDSLRNNTDLRQEIQNAEVITFAIPMKLFEKPAMALVYGNPEDCGGTDHQDCLRSALQAYEADTDAIFAEITSLHSPSDALIRTMDIYLFRVNDMKKAGVFEIFKQYWQSANEHVIQVASKYGIPVARVYADFMGPNEDEDPTDKGLLSDGFHPTNQGADRIAEIFRGLGYECAPKP